jgi:hypothetical protein
MFDNLNNEDEIQLTRENQGSFTCCCNATRCIQENLRHVLGEHSQQYGVVHQHSLLQLTQSSRKAFLNVSKDFSAWGSGSIGIASITDARFEQGVNKILILPFQTSKPSHRSE